MAAIPNLQRLREAGVSIWLDTLSRELLDDVRAAARLLRPAYEGSRGTDGFISFECTPDLADDTGATVAQPPPCGGGSPCRT